MNKDVEIRLGTEMDHAYIYSSWLSHFKNSSPFAKRIPNDIYYEKHHEVIRKILDRCYTLIACPKGEREVILGYVVFEGRKECPTLHFVYVKRHFRRMGVAATLCEGINVSSCTFTHFTRDSEWLWGTKRFDHNSNTSCVVIGKYPDMKYDPYLMGV